MSLETHTLKYAIVIPAYNEEKRFPYQEFLQFAQQHPEVLLFFVNDGSSDRTINVLRGIQVESPQNICVYDMPKNKGKAEAVRYGVLNVYERFKIQLIGFLDADLATHPDEWLLMAKFKEEKAEYGAVIGSRIQRLGAKINRDDNRSVFSRIIKMAIRMLLETRFQDSQCGAKIFERNLVPFLFNKEFLTPWLFDVEIFLRIQRKFGQSTLQNGVIEYPLMNWTEVGDSRLKFKHMMKIPQQLLQLYYQYHLLPKNKKSKGYRPSNQLRIKN